MAGTPGTFRFPEVNSTPPPPPPGYALLYIKTDNVLYLQDSSGTEIPLGSASAITALTGDVTAAGPGIATTTVMYVGGKTAVEIAQSVTDTQNATSSNTINFIVKRDGSGDIFVTHVNGVAVESHASRHLPTGADPITTAAPLSNLNASTSNATGSANSLARSDHSHAIDTAVPVSTGSGNAIGSSSSLARADHIHNVQVTNGIQNLSGILSPIYGSTSNTITQGNDARLFDVQVLKVKLSPGAGEFSSVKAAVDSITTNSSSNRYLVSVGPGIFTEDTITMKPFVSIEGAQEYSTVIQVNATNKNIIIHSNDSVVQNVTLRGATDSGKCAVIYDGAIGGPARLLNVRFGASDILIKTTSNSGPVLFEVSACSADPTADFTTGLSIQDNGTNSIDLIFQNFFMIAKTPFFTNLVDASGSLTKLRMSAINITKEGSANGIGVNLYNGVQALIGDSLFWGFSTGLKVSNTGSAPIIFLNAVSFKANTLDIDILHPSTTGAALVLADRTKTINNAPGVSFVEFDPVNAGIILTDGIFQGADFSKITDITPLIQQQSSSGLLSGGIFSISTFDVTVASGTGYLSIGVHPNDYLKYVTWNTQIVTVPSNSQSYIYIDNTGTVQYNAAIPDLIQNILIGSVIANNSAIYLVKEIPVDVSHIGNRNAEFIEEALGPVYVSGSLVTENTTPKRLDVSSGEYWYVTNNYNPSGGTAINFIPYYRNGIGGYIQLSATQDLASSDSTWLYDNGTGSLVNIPSSQYAKHSLYLVNDGANETYLLVFAQAVYATLVEVEAANIPTPPPFFSDNIVLIASIVVQQGSTHVTEIRDERPVIGFKASGISATAFHGNLLGLLNDDHPQYLKTDGTRVLTGDQSFGGHNLTSVGTVNSVTVEAHESRHLPNGADALTTAAPLANLTPVTTNAVGTANSLARSDHSHAITSGTPVTLTPDQSNSAGSAASFAKSDHIHNIPSATPVQIGTSNVAGSAASVSLSDHVHAHGNQTVGTLHAAVTTLVNGFMIAADKSKLDTVSATAATDAQILISNATTYNPRTVSGDISLTNTGAVTVNTVGTSSAANIHTAELLANAATSSGTASAIVKRDSNGNAVLGVLNNQVTKIANYTITVSDGIIFCDSSGGAFNLTLPDPSLIVGKILQVIDTTGNFNTNNVTLVRHASEKIEGLNASKVLQTNWGWFRITTNGTDWWVG